MVEHIHGKDEVTGSIPVFGPKLNNRHMAAKRKPYVKLQCTGCKRINYFAFKSKKVEEKLNLKKFCKFCRAHKAHKEIKK